MSADTALTGELPAGEPAKPHAYDAFLSYSRRDAAVADGIQKGLHQIGRRMGQLHALRVFRDKTDLAASPSLWGKISEALDRSRYLIVVLSPQAALSVWVDKEVSHWVQQRGAENLLLVLASGTLVFDEASKRFDPQLSQSALPALTQPGVLDTEAIYVDVTGDAPWDPKAPAFRDKVTDLAAPIHGKSKYDLASDDVREQRRFRRLRRAAIAALALLTVLAVGAAIVAVVQRRAAISQRDEAIALRVANEAQVMSDENRQGTEARAVQQIVAAMDIAPTLVHGPAWDAIVRRTRLVKVFETTSLLAATTAISPDGNYVAAETPGRSVRVYEIRTGQPVGQLIDTSCAQPSALAFSPDSRQLVSASYAAGHEVVQVWDVASGQPVGKPIKDCRAGFYGVAFSPDGKRVAGGCMTGTLFVWDVADGMRRLSVPTGGLISKVAFSSDGRWVAAGGKGVRVWDVATGQPISPMINQDQYVESVAFSPDGQHFVTGARDGTVQIWETTTGAPVGTPLRGHTRGVFSVAFSPDGKRIASADGDGTLRLWDAETRRPVGEPMSRVGEEMWELSFTPDSRFVISASDFGTVRVWDARDDKPVADYGNFLKENSPVFSQDGRSLASGKDDGSIRIWDTTTGEIVRKWEGAETRAVAFSPDGTRIASGGRVVQLWDTATGRQLANPFHITANLSANSVAFSPDGKYVVFGDGHGYVRVWDPSAGRLIGEVIKTGAEEVTCVAFSADGRLVVSGGGNDLKLWDAQTGKQVGQTMVGHADEVTSVAVSPDGRFIVSSSRDGTLRLWNAHTGESLREPLAAYSGGKGDTGGVRIVAVSPSARYILAGDAKGAVRMWDAATGNQLGRAITRDFDTFSFAVAFGQDDQHILTLDADGVIWSWPGPPLWHDRLCAKLTQNMSRRHWREWVSPDIPYRKVCQSLPIPPDDSP